LIGLSNNLNKIIYGNNKDFDVYGQSFSEGEFVQFKWNIKHLDLTNMLFGENEHVWAI